MNPFEQKTKFTLNDAISTLQWSPDGSRLACGTLGGEMSIWAEGAEPVRWDAHAIGVSSSAWSPDGSLLASGGQDSKLIYWSGIDGKKIREVKPGSGWVEHLLWVNLESKKESQTILFSGAGKKLSAWSLEGELLREYPEHPKTISDLIKKPNVAQVATATHGGVATWDGFKPELLRAFNWNNPILKLTWSPDGKWIAVGGQDASVHLWIAKSGEDLQMGGYSSKVRQLSWSPDSQTLATGNGLDLALWDCSGVGPEGRAPKEFIWHPKIVTALTWHPREALLVSGCEEGNVAFWKPSLRDVPIGQLSLGSPIEQVQWHPALNRIAIGTGDGAVLVFDVTL